MSTRSGWLTPSSLVLIGANLAPIIGTLWFHWSVFEIVVLFWAENVIVGMFNVLRMLLVPVTDATGMMQKIFMAAFFCVHYGMFTFVHGIFVFALFGGERFAATGVPDEVGPMLEATLSFGLGLPLLALFLSHAFSFVWNYLGKGEYLNAEIGVLMKRPYGRVVVLHIAILGGGFLVGLLGSPLAGLLLLIALKVAFDLAAHRKEHAEKLQGRLEGEPTLAEILAQLKAGERRARAAAPTPK